MVTEIDVDNPCNTCPLNCRPITPVIPYEFRFLVVVSRLSGNLVSRGEFLPEQAAAVFRSGFAAVGYKRRDFAFTSAVLCAYDPDQYSTVDNKLIQKSCKIHLDRCIAALGPEVIITAGADAAKSVLGRSVKITKARGVVEYSSTHQTYVLPTQDLTYIANYPQHIPLFDSDCRVLKRLCDNDFDQYAVQEAVEGDYKVVDDLQFLIDMEPERIAIDLETSGLRDYEDDAKIYTIQLSTEAGKGWVLPWDHPESKTFSSGRRIIVKGKNGTVPSKREKLIEQLRILLQNPKTRVGNANLKFDAGWIYRHLGFRFRIDTDVITLAKELDENLQRADLDTLTKLYVPEMSGYADKFNATYDKSRMDLVPLKELVQYGASDTDAVMRLWDALEPVLYSDRKAWVRYRRVAMPAYNAFLVMENQGVDIDDTAIGEFQEEMEAFVTELHERLLAEIPAAVKRDYLAMLADSGKKVTGKDALTLRKKDFLQMVLFTHEAGFRLIPRVFTKKTSKLANDFKVPSLSSKDHLPYFFGECAFTVDLATWVKMDRLLNTNVISFRNKYVTNGKVYPRFGMDRAVTGRTNSYDPNCFPGEVEVLTSTGWKRFDTTNGTEIVAQYDFDTNEISFAEPEDYICQPFSGQLVKLTNNSNIDIVSTSNHRFTLLTEASHVKVELVASEYREGLLQPHSGKYYDGTVSYNAWQVVIICAAQSNSEITDSGALVLTVNNGNNLHTLIEALEHEGICHIVTTKNLFQENVYIPEVSVPEYLKETCSLGSWVLLLNRDTLRLFCSILQSWCGQFERGAIYSSSKEDADYIQIMHILSGSICSIEQHEERLFANKVISNTTHLSTDNILVSNVFYSGKVYCYTMPKDSLIVRYNGKVCITNNSQNYPARGKQAKAYKKLFIPPENKIFLMSDLSQAELRIAADMSRDKLMCKIYQEDGDIHKYTACIVMGVTLEQLERMPKDEMDLARFKAKACIAEGQLVLTNEGLVPIEKVTDRHKVWDGISWVEHEGVEYQGEKYVMEYGGIIATPDHFVYTDIGVMPFYLARELGQEIIETKVDNSQLVFFYGTVENVEYLEGYLDESVTTERLVRKARGYGFRELILIQRYYTDGGVWRFGEESMGRRLLLQTMQSDEKYSIRKYSSRVIEKVCMPKGYKIRRRREGKYTWRQIRCHKTKMQEYRKINTKELRGERSKVQVQEQGAFYKICFRRTTTRKLLQNRYRQDRQQWTLFTREYKVNYKEREFKEQENKSLGRVQREENSSNRFIGRNKKEVSDIRVREKYYYYLNLTGAIPGRYCFKVVCEEPVSCYKTKTYDPINAGHNHRFTLNGGHTVAQCNFGFLYGMSWKKFIIYAKTQYGVDFTENEAIRIRQGFFDRYASLQKWHDRVKALAREQLWVRSYTGKVRHLPMIESPEEYIRAEAERQSINSPVQCTASDFGVIAVSRIDQEIRPECMLPIGFVHDAIYIVTEPKYIDWGARTLKYYMESTPVLEWFGVDMKVPIKADVSFGPNMGELCELKGLSSNKKIDFRQLEIDNSLPYRIPRQVIPENNGRRHERPYAEIEIDFPQYE